MAAPGGLNFPTKLRVALEAEFVLFFQNHPGRAGSVGIVAGQAIPSFERIVDGAHCLFLQHLLMASGTERDTCRFQ